MRDTTVAISSSTFRPIVFGEQNAPTLRFIELMKQLLIIQIFSHLHLVKIIVTWAHKVNYSAVSRTVLNFNIDSANE